MAVVFQVAALLAPYADFSRTQVYQLRARADTWKALTACWPTMRVILIFLLQVAGAVAK